MYASGTRAQVMHGTASKTPGGLTKDQLKYNKHGRIVSKKRSAKARKDNRLVKAGYVTKKGVFGSKLVDKPRKSIKKSLKKSLKKKGRSKKRRSSNSWF